MNCENYFKNDDKSYSFVGNISFSNFNQPSSICDQNEDESKNIIIEEASSNKKTKETFFSNYKDFPSDEKETIDSFICWKCNTEILDFIYFCVNCEYLIHQRCAEGTNECARCREPLSTIILEEDSTLETSGFLKLLNTNINNLENYQEFYDLSNKLEKDKYLSLLSNSLLKSKEMCNSNKKPIDSLKRTALSPISVATPFSIKSRMVNKDLANLKKSEESKTPCNKKRMEDEIYYDRSPYISDVKQKLFVSPLRTNDLMDINDQLNNSFKNNNYAIESETNFIYHDKDDSFENDQTRKFFTTTFITNKHKKRYDDSNSKENFFKSLNFESNNILFENLQFKHDFKSLDFDSENFFNESTNDNTDKENTPCVPKDSSKFSIADNSPIDVNIEAGISHINTYDLKVHEVPIVIDLKLKENVVVNYSKDYVLVFNSKNLSHDYIKSILILFSEKLKENDRVFTNIFKIDRWITKFELMEIINNFESFLISQETILTYSDILNLTFFCIELANDLNSSDVFSMILINDLDEMNINDNYQLTLAQISDKINELKAKTNKNFTINSIVLDKQSNNQQNLKFLSCIYDLSMITLGYFFSPKNFNELNKCFHILLNMLNQTGLINVKANIIGNKDPSVVIDIFNYPKIKLSHNNYEVYLGNLTRKEKKILTLETKIFLSNPKIKMCLPLLELNFEIFPPNKTNNTGQNNTFKKYFISPINISLPLINTFKELEISKRVFLRFSVAKVSEILNEALDLLRSFNFDGAFSKISNSKHTFEKILKDSGLLSYLNKLFDHLNLTLNSSTLTSSNLSFSNHSNDLLLKAGSDNISKILNFCILVLNDINRLTEIISTRNFNYLSDFFISANSLGLYRPTQLNDDRFLDDLIDLN